MKKRTYISTFRVNFLTGLAVVLPGIISIGLLVFIFGTVSNFTDRLLFFLPHSLTHEADQNGIEGPMLWFWSLAAMILAVFLVALAGKFTRYYIGRQLIAVTDQLLMGVPLLNKIYSTVKQVNEAFKTNKSSFKQVVMVTFPHSNLRSVGFITGERKGILAPEEMLFIVFVPTTPNPTSGFIVMARESEIVRLDMTVADGIKFIVSLGCVAPERISAVKTPEPAPPQSPQ